MPRVSSRVSQTFGVIRSWYCAWLDGALAGLVKVTLGPFQMVAACAETTASSRARKIGRRTLLQAAQGHVAGPVAFGDVAARHHLVTGSDARGVAVIGVL